jgi:hypothetical protein
VFAASFGETVNSDEENPSYGTLPIVSAKLPTTDSL